MKGRKIVKLLAKILKSLIVMDLKAGLNTKVVRETKSRCAKFLYLKRSTHHSELVKNIRTEPVLETETTPI